MLNTDEIYQEMFPLQVRKVLASSIYVASQMSKNLRDEMLSIPKRASMLAGHAFPVFVDRLMAEHIDNTDIGSFLYEHRERSIPKCGHSYIEYHCPKGKFHIKKSDKKGKLPKAAVHRRSNAESNKIFLDLGPEYILQNVSVPFALVTYGHNRFDLSYIEVGFPSWDYTDWQENKRWDISGDVSTDVAEYIRERSAAKLKEEFQEQIKPAFKLKLK